MDLNTTSTIKLYAMNYNLIFTPPPPPPKKNHSSNGISPFYNIRVNGEFVS